MKNILIMVINKLLGPFTSVSANDSVDIMKTYHENGKLESETPYKNCKKHGSEKWYYKNGKLNYKTQYKNGEIHGIAKWYYESGQLAKEELYVDGKYKGTNYYNKNGQI